jgi:hypothetical protein
MAGMVGHNMLRMYVMGEAAWDRPATEQERAQIAALLDDSLAAGAAAMSTSLGFDEDRDKRPVPSRQADDAELGALLDVLARHNKFVQFIPAATGRQMRRDVQRMADLTGPRGVVSTWIGVFHDQDHPDWARGMLDFAAGAGSPRARRGTWPCSAWLSSTGRRTSSSPTCPRVPGGCVVRRAATATRSSPAPSSRLAAS